MIPHPDDVAHTCSEQSLVDYVDGSYHYSFLSSRQPRLLGVLSMLQWWYRHLCLCTCLCLWGLPQGSLRQHGVPRRRQAAQQQVVRHQPQHLRLHMGVLGGKPMPYAACS